MPKGDNLNRVRQPKEQRAKTLGVTLLADDELARNVHIRGKKEVVLAFVALPPSERGEVVRLGLEAKGVAKGESQHGT